MQQQEGVHELRMAELLAALSIAQDLGVGFPRGYVLRTCYIATRLADALGVSLVEQRDVFYAALLAHGGCTCYTAQIAAFIRGDERAARRDLVFLGDYTDQQEVLRWVRDHVGANRPVMERAGRVLDFMFHGRDFFREGFASAGEVARRLAQRLGLPDGASSALPSLFEHWDGGGLPLGLRGEAIPHVARIVGASIYLAGWHMQGGRDAARHIAGSRSATAFDPAVAAAFLRLSQQEDFWRGLEHGDVRENAVALEPGPPLPADDDALDAAALTLADFVDMKAFYLAGRSRRVADLARAVGERLGRPDGRTLWRAGLMHDCGHVASPSFLLDKPDEDLGEAELAARRQHPDIAGDILASVEAFAGEQLIVRAHHERIDGRGYPQGLLGDAVPVAAQIVSVADTFDELTHNGPRRLGATSEQALSLMAKDAGYSYDTEVFAAFSAEIRGVPVSATARPRPGRVSRPADLTDREIEVLRLLGTGVNRREIAAALVVSESTVRHHLEHIYNKIGVSTRVAAVLFAMEHGLLS